MNSWVLSTESGFTLAVPNEKAPQKHDIVAWKDLIESFQESTWALETDNLVYGNANLNATRVSKDIRNGYFDQTGTFVETSDVNTGFISINGHPLENIKLNKIRGSYMLDLPDYKRIQLEVDYELPTFADGQMNDSEFYVEVFTKDKNDLSQWVKDKEKRQEEDLKASKLKVRKYNGKDFITHSYVVDLSEWSGQSIRLDLVSELSKNSQVSTGRWVNLKIVAATFNYKVARTPEEDELYRKTASYYNTDSSSNVLPQNTLLSPQSANVDTTIGELPIDGLVHMPEGFSVYYMANQDGRGNRYIGYFHANYGPKDWDATPYEWWETGDEFTDGVVKGGTFAFDLTPGWGMTFYDYWNTYLPYELLRDNSGTIIRSPNVNYKPYSVFSPSRSTNWKKGWSNGYTLVSVRKIAQDQLFISGFTHTEDWSMDGINKNVYYINNIQYYYAYARIGYVRASLSNPYSFSYVPCWGDAAEGVVNSASPIIECFQPESVRDDNNHGLLGTAGPAPYVRNGNVYLFYTRYVDPSYMDSLEGIDPEIRTKTNYVQGNGQVCVARAPVLNVCAQSYSSIANPWYNYYDGQWNQSGRDHYGKGGFSTAVLNDQHRIVAQAFDSSILNGLVILTGEMVNDENDNPDFKAYLYLSPNYDPSNFNQTGIRIEGVPENAFANRLINNIGGDDSDNGYNRMTLYCAKQGVNNPSHPDYHGLARYSMYFYP